MSGRIAHQDIDRVRAASDLADIAGERIALSRSGGRFWALCPFHDEKSKSFSISPDAGLYYCFGCNAGGDVFKFVQELDGVTFVDAVEKLAARAGITLTYTGESAADRNRRQMKPRLAEAMKTAVEFYANTLRSDREASLARSYLSGRDIPKDVATHFKLGFAPDEWDALVKHLKSRGFRSDEIESSGLAKRSSRDNLIDHLRGRVIFPIFDAEGNPVAVAGRVLPGGRTSGSDDGSDQGPKYVNSPETTLYHKSRTLYGLNWAKPTIVERGEAVVVEGYTDVIGMHCAGTTNAIATCGTALGDDHLRLLKRWTSRVVLAFDGDAAGARATERIFSSAFELGLDMRVAILPEGTDPADLAKQGPEAVAAVFDNSTPLLEFKVDRELARHAVDSVENEARALDAALSVAAVHPDAMVRSGVARSVARKMRDVSEDDAVRRVEQLRAAAAGAQSRTSAAASGRRGGDGAHAAPDSVEAPAAPINIAEIEEHALAMLLQYPRDFLAFDSEQPVSAEWFSQPVRPLAERLIACARSSQDGRIDVAALVDPGSQDTASETGTSPSAALSAGEVALVRRLAVWRPPGIDEKERHFAYQTAQRLFVRYLDTRIRILDGKCAEAERGADTEHVKTLNAELVAFIQRRQALGTL